MLSGRPRVLPSIIARWCPRRSRRSPRSGAVRRPSSTVQAVVTAGAVLPRMGNGGAEEDRTPDLRIANATLSQLSYGPTRVAIVADRHAA